MATINILGMSRQMRQELAKMAGRKLAMGDDCLARQVAVAAARQFAAQSRHHADEIGTMLGALRKSLTDLGTDAR